MKSPRSLLIFGLLVTNFLAATGLLAQASFDVRAFGAKGDGQTLDTPAINQAIAAAADAGGGTVIFPSGNYLSYSIRLKSNITLLIGPGATIIGAESPPIGQPGGYDPAEPNASSQFQDFGHSHWHNSLIWGEDLHDVSITGPGRIYGRGLSRGNSRIALPVNIPPPPLPGDIPPDALAADGPFDVTPRPDLIAGPFGYPNARDTQSDGVGNKAIALKNCRNVTLRDFSILHGGHFGILATGVDNLTLDNLIIDTNRDGMDIDSCANVRISNCSINTLWDDGLCLKASYGLGVLKLTENVTITNCYVSGYDEGTLLDGTRQRKLTHRGGSMGRIKLGTEASGGFRNITISNCVFDSCRGLALEQVDGGILEDITVSNITMRNVQNAPIFIRLGARLRSPGVTQPGSVRRILINNLVASNVAPEHGILIAGLPGHPIEDVVLSNIQIHYAGGGTSEQATRTVPELEKAYPDPYDFGTLPSWGLFARHVKGLQLRGVELRLDKPDARPAITLDDTIDVNLRNIDFDAAEKQPAWSLTNVSLHARDVTRLPNGNRSTLSIRELR